MYDRPCGGVICRFESDSGFTFRQLFIAACVDMPSIDLLPKLMDGYIDQNACFLILGWADKAHRSNVRWALFFLFGGAVVDNQS